jgi:hypothetical protein
MMELDEEDAFRRHLATFKRPTELYPHPSQALVYTPGVQCLAERLRLHWLIDLIAAWQPRALKDPSLAEIQFWELHITGRRGVAICGRGLEDVAFRLDLAYHDSELAHVRLYVYGGVLMLPSEH